MKQFQAIIILLLSIILVACGDKQDDATSLKVGVISGPETDLVKVAQQVAKQQDDFNIKIIEFSDYAIPNIALNDGSIGANVFQHLPYLQASNQAHRTHLVPVGKTFIYPMGLYSKKITDLSQLKSGDSVATPNDPSNEARALLLLEKAGLIQLKTAAGTEATVNDIVVNSKNLKIIPLNAAQLPRTLDDITLVAINTNYAVPAGLDPTSDALFLESKDSLYANIIVVRDGDQDKPQTKILLSALNSPQVEEKAQQLFNGYAIKAW